MSLLRSVLLTRNLQLPRLNILKRLTSSVELSRCFPAFDASDRRKKFLIPNNELSQLKCRSYAKQVKGGGGKKVKGGKKSLGEIVDDLDSDSDDDDDDNVDAKKSQSASHEHDDEYLGHTPAAAFMQSFGKVGKKEHHKDKIGWKLKAKGGHMTMVTYQEAMKLINVDQFWQEMEDILNQQREYFIHHLTLRSSSSLDDLPIVLEGDTYPLRELADISKKDPKRIVIDTSAFPQATVNIMKVLRENSGLNLNPQQEGTRIYVPIPKVTREHREKLAKGAKQKCNETKDLLRKVQSKKSSKLGEIELEGKIHAPKDNFLAVHDILLAMTDHFAHEAEAMAIKKQKDLMESS